MFNLLFFLSLLLPPTHAAITPEHFGGMYTLQHGQCAKSLTILVNSTTIPAPTILSGNTTCSGSTITLSQPEKNSPKSFAVFLQVTAIGEFYSADIKNLTCGTDKIEGDVFILRPEEDFTIPQQTLSFFPGLNQTFPNGIILSDEYIYIFVSSCIYKRKAPEDTGIIDNIVNSISECLPADAKIHTQTGPTLIEKLKTGDNVLSTEDDYSKIIGWTHKDALAISRFIKISFGNTSIAVTPGHHIYAGRSTIPARKVKKGMLLRTLHGEVPVNHAEVVWKRGLYNPQTLSGDLVVNGVVVSTYTEAVPPVMAHALLTPFRLAFSLFWTTRHTPK